MENEKISFSYKDYRDGGKQKEMSLSADEFLRRFSLHILPSAYRKIRHYGILASRNKKKLKALQSKMGVKPEKENESYQSKFNQKKSTEKLCPCCKKAQMEVIRSFDANGPPLDYILKNRPKLSDVF